MSDERKPSKIVQFQIVAWTEKINIGVGMAPLESIKTRLYVLDDNGIIWLTHEDKPWEFVARGGGFA